MTELFFVLTYQNSANMSFPLNQNTYRRRGETERKNWYKKRESAGVPITVQSSWSLAAMTQSNGENPQRTRSGLHQIRAGIQSRSLMAKKRVENISKNDVKGFFMRNAFVIFTIAAVIIGEWEEYFVHLRHCSDTELYWKLCWFKIMGKILGRIFVCSSLSLLYHHVTSPPFKLCKEEITRFSESPKHPSVSCDQHLWSRMEERRNKRTG